MLHLFYKIYGHIFSRSFFIGFNQILYQLSLRGLGVLNYENLKITGEYSFIKRLLRVDGMVVFDIGANSGQYSIMLKKINATTRVYSFEPHPKTFQRLLNNSMVFNFKPFNFAFGKEEGLVKLFDYKDMDGSSHASIYKNVIENIHNKIATEHTVQLRTVDAFWDAAEDIDLLKIDVEGCEYDVLLGAENLLRNGKIKVIQFEFSQLSMIDRIFLKDFFILLSDFKFYRLLSNGLMPLSEYDPSYCEIFLFQNIIAVHSKHLSLI